MNFKKLLSGVMAVVTAITAMAAVATSASAAKTYEIYLDNYSVGTITNGKEFTVTQTGCEDGGFKWFIMNIKATTILDAVRTDSTSWDGAKVTVYEYINKTTAGKSIHDYSGKFSAEDQIKLEKGSYFVQITPKKDVQSCNFKFSWKEPAPAADTVKSLKVYIPLSKGDKMNLSTVVDNPKAKIAYTSSNTSVATVSSKGIVTAKKAGKVSITIKAGTKTVRLYFKVS